MHHLLLTQKDVVMFNNLITQIVGNNRVGYIGTLPWQWIYT